MFRFALPVLSALMASTAFASSDVATAGDGSGAIGHIACAIKDGEPLKSCPAETLNKEDGSRTLRVLLANGDVRLFFIADGEITGTNSLEELGYKRGGAKTFAHIPPMERYEIPNALIDGE